MSAEPGDTLLVFIMCLFFQTVNIPSDVNHSVAVDLTCAKIIQNFLATVFFWGFVKHPLIGLQESDDIYKTGTLLTE